MSTYRVQFTIPFCVSTTFGLGAAALEHTPAWPSYPDPMTAADINGGLPMPYTAYAILGKGGVVAVLLMLFQAITSALSSEIVAVSSLITYDFYRSYINPAATGRQLVLISHTAVIVFGLLVACIATGLCYSDFSVSFIVTAIGILIDGNSTLLCSTAPTLTVLQVPSYLLHALSFGRSRASMPLH